MITIGLSVSSGIKLLERNLMVRMRSISRMAKDAVYSVAPAAADVKTAVATNHLQPLGVAKTTLPETRLDFNQTFQHVRFELETLYKAQNPIFNNSAVPELWISKEAASAKEAGASKKHIDSTLGNGASSFSWHATTPALSIAKTTLPDERLDFNQTFERVHYELEALYKAQNPIFRTVSKQQDSADKATVHTLSSIAKDSAQEAATSARRLETVDRPAVGNIQAALQAMPVA